ncbi:MAG: PEP-CTERM system histidine kinase PrsK [Deltaproteobacteria bacterium]|nr:PEP-CTERM system histidine kinase PrsK [Deltaproteobacteria bacterium]
MGPDIILIFFLVGIILFGIFIFARKRHFLSSLLLFCALLCCGGVEIFDNLVFRHPENFFFWKKATLLSESLLPPLWLSFAFLFSKQGGFRALTVFQRLLLSLSLLFFPVALFSPLGGFFYSPDFPQERLIFLGSFGYPFYFALLLYFILALAQLEKTLTVLPALEKWRVKFELVGAGVILAMFIVYYSQGLLYRTLNMSLVPIRNGVELAGLGMMFYSGLRRGGLSGLYVSREIAFRSVVVLIIGIYFLGLGLMGEGMRYLGASSQETFFWLVAFLVGAAMAMVLLSETVKRKLKIYLHKNFYRQKYDYRNQWLEFTRSITGKSNVKELGGAILSFFSATFAVPSAALFLWNEEESAYTCAVSLEMEPSGPGFSRASPLVRYLAERHWVFNSRDVVPEIDEKSREFLARYRVSHIVPLEFEERLEGFIVLGRSVNQGEVATYEDFDLMKVLGRQAAYSLMGQKLAAELSAQREMASLGKISAFVIHDLKNLVSALAMTAENAKDFIGEPEFQKDLLSTLSGSVGKMKGLISWLKDFQGKKILERKPCDLKRIAEECRSSLNPGAVEVFGEPVLVEGDAAELQRVLLNLVMNGIEAGRDRAPVEIRVGKNGQAFLRVTDQGAGMSRDFIENRLFRPFQTTKNHGFGIGLYQCKNIVEAHGGRIEVQSEVGEGSTFTLFLPLASESCSDLKSQRAGLVDGLP